MYSHAKVKSFTEASALQRSKKSQEWLHSWKLPEKSQTHLISIWKTLDIWAHKCSYSTNLKDKATPERFSEWGSLYEQQFGLATEPHCKSGKVCVVLPITSELTASTYHSGQSVLSLLSYICKNFRVQITFYKELAETAQRYSNVLQTPILYAPS